MKILKAGEENYKVWKIEETCTGKGWEQNGNVPCGALLEVSAQDILYRDYADYSGDSERYYGFICPICKCFTELYNIPRYIMGNSTSYKNIKDDGDK